MKNLRTLASITVVAALYVNVLAQGGGMGGGFGGNFGGGGMNQGPGGGMSQGPGGGIQQNTQDSMGRSIDGAIATYLDVSESRSILTPGEYCEWKLDLKAGQVVIADAKSDMFDPAIEIADSKDVVLASNDDRYPGDQRPLLLYRCAADGSYSLKVRCFRNKSGGQFTSRFKVYNTLDAGSDEQKDYQIKANAEYLIRIPMKAQEFRELRISYPDPKQRVDYSLGGFISPIGLPVSYAGKTDFTPLQHSVIAPVDGDYFCLVDRTFSNGAMGIGTHLLKPAELEQTGKSRTGKAKTGTHMVWRVPAKAGELLEFSTPELYYHTAISIWVEPDFKSFDLKVPEKNPFYPDPNATAPTLATLPSHERESRYQIRSIPKDMVLWVYTSGAGPKTGDFSFTVKPAASKFEEGKRLSPRLSLGANDYWEFDAAAGDVMTIDASTTSFLAEVEILNADLRSIASMNSDPDSTPMHHTMTVTTPGRYIVSVKSMGNGGGGEYSLNRQVYPAKVFKKDAPAKGDIAKGEVHVWKFTTDPGKPVLFRESSSLANVEFTLLDGGGFNRSYGIAYVNMNNRYGILSSSEPMTYIVIVTGLGSKSNYRLEILDLPGLAETKK